MSERLTHNDGPTRAAGTPYDVLVVGAGPAGSHAARRLAEAGHAVALVDESEGPRAKIVCTGILGLEAFRAFDLPEESVVDTIRSARFFSPSLRDVPYEPPEPLAHVVDRTRFDAALAGRAEAAGAELLRGHAARGVSVNGRVEVSCETADGPRTLAARAMVVATGHQRWLHEQAGLGSPPGYVHGVQADLPMEGVEEAELYFGNRLAPGFFAWAVPYGGEARLGVLAPQGAREHFRRLLSSPAVRERLGVDPANGGAELVERRLRSRGIVQGPVTPSYADRTLAVGEAAGQVKTTTAGGIYYGMIGAELAAQVLDDRLRSDRLDAPSLAAYESEWQGRLAGEMESGLKLQRAVRGLDDPRIDRIFALLQNGLGAAVRRVVRFDWHRAALELLVRAAGGAQTSAGGKGTMRGRTG